MVAKIADMFARVKRFTETYRRLGLTGTVKVVWARVRYSFQHLVLREQHIWYEMPLDGNSIKVAIPEGFVLKRASEADLPLAATTGKDPDLARSYLADGHDLWLMTEGGTAAFSCWVFRGKAPTLAAKGGWLKLPDDVINVEDSFTNPEFRGRGVLPAAMGQISMTLYDEGIRYMVTKITVDNQSSHRAALKSGFIEVGVMKLDRVGPFRNTRLENPSGATGQLLADSLRG